MAVESVDARMIREKLCDEFERVRSEHVVAVEICHDLAGGVSEAAHDGVGLAEIRRRFDMSQAWRVTGENFPRLIAASAIHDYVFELGKILKQDAAQSPFEKPALIERRCDDGDGHAGKKSRASQPWPDNLLRRSRDPPCASAI